MRLDETAKGVFTIAVTPFLPDGALDLDSVDRMVDFYVEKGATGLTIDAAYVAAGYRQHRGNAARLSANERVQRRVRELQEETARRAGIEAAGFIAEA